MFVPYTHIYRLSLISYRKGVTWIGGVCVLDVAAILYDKGGLSCSGTVVKLVPERGRGVE